MTKGVILQQRKKPLTVSEQGNSSTCTKAGRWKVRDNLQGAELRVDTVSPSSCCSAVTT